MTDKYTYQEAIITRRDMFAAFAMMGILTREDVLPIFGGEVHRPLIKHAFAIADAMITESNKNEAV